MPRWRSSGFVLATIGAAGVSACSDGGPCEQYLGHIYANIDDCRRDYPNGGCLTETGQDGAIYAYGPWYLADRGKAPVSDPGQGAEGGKAAIGTDRSRRRGFGSTGETTRCSS